MNRYLIVDAGGFVVNVVLWDGVAPYASPAGTSVHPWYEGADIGLAYAPPAG